jgi:hypothetical protein
MLKASNSRFNAVTLTTSESVIRDSSAKSIVVKRPDSDAFHQKLMLYGDTHIEEIVFESGRGEVHVQGSTVKVGKVTGAKIIQAPRMPPGPNG